MIDKVMYAISALMAIWTKTRELFRSRTLRKRAESAETRNPFV
jgi:hypothetical protein